MPAMPALTHLGTFLNELMKEEGIDAKTMAERTAVDPAVLSRLMTGKRRTCNEQTKRRIVSRCSPDEAVQGRCLIAHLKDQLFPPFDNRIRISLHP